MKLRNKKTGEIGLFTIVRRYRNLDDYTITFNELVNDWELYTPAEPLIKDEKDRKAVRVWAEANDLSENLRVINEHFACCKIIGRSDDRNICLCIEFKSTIAHADKNKFYTITELCGEEEE